MRKIRIGVSGHDLKFWHPLQRALEATGKYEFREDVWSGHDQHDAATTKAVLEWADVLVAEWALGNAVHYSRHKRSHQRLVVRLHLQERGTAYPAAIDYGNVDQVVFVGQHILDECVAKFGIPANLCSVIGNFVDVDRFSLPKFGGAEYTLGIIGTVPSRKRLDLALDTLELLHRKDERYALRVKGESPARIPWLWARTSEREYYERVYSRINSGSLRHRVIFDPQGSDVQHWLKMIGALLSPSDFESFHVAVAEGAASGALPIVWNWDGAALTYPEFPLVDSAAAAADLIDFHVRSASGPRYRAQVKEIIRARYDSAVISDRWDEVLTPPLAHVAQTANKGRRPRPVVIAWAIDNWPTFHRREMLQALAGNLRDEFDLLVIEPGTHYGAILAKGWADRAELDRLVGGELIQVEDNIYRGRLITGGIPGTGVDTRDQFAVLDALIRQNFGLDATVTHWVYKPDQALRLGDQPFIYEVYDDYTFDFGSGAELPRVKQDEALALVRAKHIFFTSAPLMERKPVDPARATLVGNGVEYQAFARYRPSGIVRNARPVAGYLGNLSDFFDWDLMRQVCSDMPDIDFVFHGQIEKERLGDRLGCYSDMAQLRNVRFSGRVSRPLGATAIARYDVLLIPFVVNEAMHAVNPLKLWEYFATGLPVISSPMDAVGEPEPLMVVADGTAAWIDGIRRCLGDAFTNDIATQLRLDRAMAHDWKSLTKAHSQVLRSLHHVDARDGMSANVL